MFGVRCRTALNVLAVIPLSTVYANLELALKRYVTALPAKFLYKYLVRQLLSSDYSLTPPVLLLLALSHWPCITFEPWPFELTLP